MSVMLWILLGGWIGFPIGFLAGVFLVVARDADAAAAPDLKPLPGPVELARRQRKEVA